ncbi:RIP metalloprotease RseP [soil metagenome]
MTILAAILGLIALIVIHELGHMLAAKAMGVHVPEFGVGFGPALIKKKIGKTVYSFRVILLGGFAKMEGMEGMASVEKETGEFGPDAYPSKPAWRRAVIILAGPLANLLAAVVIFAVLFMGVSPPTTEVESVVSGSLAEQVGLQEGDRIVSVEGQEIEDWGRFQQAVDARSPGDEVELVVERGGEREEFSGALTADERDPERALVGVQPKLSEEETYGPLQALGLGVERTFQIIGLFGWFIGQLATGEVSFYDSVSSPIGVVGVSSDVAAQGAQSFAALLALISLNLAIFNLLPILPLDGGHLFFIAAEKVLGRPVSAETVAKVAALGLALILMLFVFATYADLSKIFTGQPFIPDP